MKIKKSEDSDKQSTAAALSERINSALISCEPLFRQYDRIIIYYDNGQEELNAILKAAFCSAYPRVEFRRVKPADYALFQAADLCSGTKPSSSITISSMFFKPVIKPFSVPLLLRSSRMLARDAAQLLFQVISACYERKSLIITSNLEFSGWNTVLGDNRLTAALIDRLVHHSHIVIFTGESYRLQQSMLRRKTPRVK